MEGMSKEGKGKRRKSRTSSGIKGTTKEETGVLYKKKCAGR